MKVTYTESDDYLVEGNYGGSAFSSRFKAFPHIIHTRAGEILLREGENQVKLRKEFPIFVQVLPTLWAAQRFKGKLSVSSGGDRTSVAILSVNETHTRRGETFLTELIKLYNKDASLDQNNAAQSVLAFLEQRLAEISAELKTTEEEREDYRTGNHISILGTEGQIALSGEDLMMQQLSRINTNKIMLDYVDKTFQELNSNSVQPIPAAIAYFDGSLSGNIAAYNNLIATKKRFMALGTDPSLPVMQRLENSIKASKEQLFLTVEGLRYQFGMQEKQATELDETYTDVTLDYPRRDREYEVLNRRQTLWQSIANELSMRREQLKMALAVDVSNAKVLEYPLGGGMIY